MIKRMILGGTMLLLAGCANTADQMPLVFARTQTFGANLSGSVPDQGAALTLGFGDRNVAIVPTTDRNGSPIRSKIDNVESGKGSKSEEALSVLGQFEANSKASASLEAGLGTFFATGTAARNLSEGFADKVSGKYAK